MKPQESWYVVGAVARSRNLNKIHRNTSAAEENNGSQSHILFITEGQDEWASENQNENVNNQYKNTSELPTHQNYKALSLWSQDWHSKIPSLIVKDT